MDELLYGLDCDATGLKELKSSLLSKGFIREDWSIPNWEKRQFSGQKSSYPVGVSRSRGYVYYVADSGKLVVNSSRIKIGFSSNPWARIKELRTTIPSLKILATEPGDFDLETKVHQMFAHSRKDGEWFIASQDLIDYVAKLRSSDDKITTVATSTEQNRPEQNRPEKADFETGEELMAAHWLLEELGCVADNGVRRVAAESIRLLAKEGGDVQTATEYILKAGKQAKDCGEIINRFWFTDQRYRPQEQRENRKQVDNPGAQNQRELSDAEAYAMWQGMSEEFKQANPWKVN